jgi:hypothetical protein
VTRATDDARYPCSFHTLRQVDTASELPNSVPSAIVAIVRTSASRPDAEVALRGVLRSQN